MDAALGAPGAATRSWRQETLINDGGVYFDSLLDAIARARHRIDAEVYIFALDRTGRRVADALCAAARRGVRVRVIVDGIGSLEHGQDLAEQLNTAGAQARIYRPLPWYVNAYRWSLQHGNAIQKFIHSLLFINRRNHRKLFLIDGCEAWVGSFNICDDHLPLARGGKGWRDYGAQLFSPQVESLERNFEQLWQTRLALPAPSTVRFYLSNLSPQARRMKHGFLLERLQQARRRIWICTAYFSPSNRTLQALKAAAQRGVDVRVVVTRKSDVALFPILTATYYGDLLRAGVRIFEYQQSMLHAKLSLIDELCIVGSSNLNHRSLLHDLELDVLLVDNNSLEDAERGIQTDLANAREVTLEELPRHQLSIALGWLPRLLRYWM